MLAPKAGAALGAPNAPVLPEEPNAPVEPIDPNPVEGAPKELVAVFWPNAGVLLAVPPPKVLFEAGWALLLPNVFAPPPKGVDALEAPKAWLWGAPKAPPVVGAPPKGLPEVLPPKAFPPVAPAVVDDPKALPVDPKG